MKTKRNYILSLIYLLLFASFGIALESDQTDELARMLAKDITDSFPTFSGMVLSTRGDDGVFIDIGQQNGLTVGETFEVYSQGNKILRNEKGEFIRYEGDKIALIKVEWLETDYSFARIIESYSDQAVDSYDFLYHVPSMKTLYIHEFKGQFGIELTEKISPNLAQVPFLKIVNNPENADYILDGEISKKSYGLAARILIYKKGTINPLATIERGLSSYETDINRPIIGNGYKAWHLPANIADFIFLENEKLLLLGKDALLLASLSPLEMKIERSFPFETESKIKTREPIGRLQAFDLDKDGSYEILASRAEDNTGRYYTNENGDFAFAGYIPGIPLSADSKGNLLISETVAGYNLFNPSKTRILKITNDGFLRETPLSGIPSAFTDAALIDFDGDSEPHIVLIHDDGKISLLDDGFKISSTGNSDEEAGLGIYQDENKTLFTSSKSGKNDCIISWTIDKGRFIKKSQSPSIPYKIYRIRDYDSNIAALALDDNNMPFLILFDEF